ncbi:MAG: hypothetical protein AAFR13_09315 [Pseudomonadota bacterium]
MPTDKQRDATQMPVRLIYGLLAKGVLVVVVIIGVLYYAQTF